MGIRIAGMLAMTGALTGFFIALTVPHTFEARATLQFIRQPGIPQDMYDRESHAMLDSAAARATSTQALTSFIGRNARLREMVTADPVDEVVEKLRKAIHIDFVNLPDHLNGIAVRYEDEVAEDALDIARELTVHVAAMAKGYSPMADGKEVTQLAGFPVVEPTGTTVPRTTVLGFVAGLALGIFAWALLRGKPIPQA